MKKLLLILPLFMLSCDRRQGIIFEKQGYYIDRYKDTIRLYKVKDLITGDYAVVDKNGKFNVGDQIAWEGLR